MGALKEVSIAAAVRKEIASYFSTLDPNTYCIYGLSDLSLEIVRELKRKNVKCTLISDDFKGASFKHCPVIPTKAIPANVRLVVVVCKPNKFPLIQRELRHRAKQQKSIVHFYPRALNSKADYVKFPDFEAAKKLIDKHRVVSFDLFGTLIVRNLFTDDSIFKIFDTGLTKRGQRGFWDSRKMHEGSFLFDNPKNLTLNNIYRGVLREHPEFRKVLAELPSEFELDRSLWSIEPRILALLKYAVAAKKRVVLISDTFYTKIQLQSFLGSHLPRKVELLVSNDLGISKSSGDFFAFAKKRYGEKIVHFGDSLHADINCAKRHGVTAVLVRNPTDVTQYPDPEQEKKLRTNTLDEYALSCFNRLRDDKTNTYRINSEEDLATILFSPFLFNYFNWLSAKLVKLKIDHVFFCAREGYFLQSLFNAYLHYKGLDKLITKQSYLKCSRNIALLGKIYKRSDIYETFKLHRYEGTLYNLLRSRFRLSATRVDKKLKEVFLDTRKESAESHLAPFEQDILNKAKELRSNYQRYLKSLVKSSHERIAIVDQGAAGTVQKFIGTLLKNQIHGLYVCHYKHNPLGHKSYYGMVDADKSLFFKVNHIFESILTSPTGSYVWCHENGRFGTGKKFTNQRCFGFRRRVIKRVLADLKLFTSIEHIEQPKGGFNVNVEIIERIFGAIFLKKLVFGDDVANVLYFDNELVRPLSEHKIK